MLGYTSSQAEPLLLLAAAKGVELLYHALGYGNAGLKQFYVYGLGNVVAEIETIHQRAGGTFNPTVLQIEKLADETEELPRREFVVEERKIRHVAEPRAGFERLLMFVTGMGNIRDVIPFPRAPRQAEF